jgi:hypothetical protein
MLETLKYWWVTKTFVAPAAIVVLVILGGLWSIVGFSWSDKAQEGRVLSTASLPVVGNCPQGNEVASVKLANGNIVTAYALYGRFVQRGAKVLVRKQLSACDAAGYQIVGLR